MSLPGLLYKSLAPTRLLATRLTASGCLSPCFATRPGWSYLTMQQSVSSSGSIMLSPSTNKAALRVCPANLFTLCRKGQHCFSTSVQHQRRETKQTDDKTIIERKVPETIETQAAEQGMRKDEQPAQESQIDLPAKLSKEGKVDSAGLGEIWRLMQVARPELKWLLLAFSLLAVCSLISMIIPYAIGKVMDVGNAASNGKDVRVLGFTIYQFLFGLASIFTVGAMANFGSIILLRVLGERVVARLRSQLYRRIYMQNAEFLDANRVGDLLSRLTLDAAIVAKSVTQNLSHGLSNFCISVTGLSIMFWTSPKLTGLLLLMFPPAAIGAIIYGIAIRNISKALQKTMGSLTKTVEERLGSMKTTQAFVGEAQEVRQYNKQVRSVFTLGYKESLVQAIFHASTEWAGDMMIIAIMLFGLTAIKSSVLSSGDLTSFMLYAVFTGSGLFGLSSFYSELMKGVGAAGRLFELQDKRPNIPHTVGRPIHSAKGPIKFNNVNFSYPTRPGVKIFDDLTFEIPSGSNVCVVSASGGGKSTIASLLLRLYSPTSGSISINGMDIREMNAKSLRRRIGMVSQEPILFSGTLAENIAYGKPTAMRSEIVAAAKKANCDFIDDLPAGFETQVGARGSQMSGGQKQRIAIARALLKAPDILILDEATSALDAKSEKLVGEALAGLLRGHNTTISIAHRLSTIRKSDQVIVLNEGRVVEVGTYAQLSADKNSAFLKLMEWQMAETTGSEDPETEATK